MDNVSLTPTNPMGYQLLHEGALTLSRATANGILVDMDYIAEQKPKITKRVTNLRESLADTAIVKKWQSKYGGDFNWDSNDQLADILFNELDYEPSEFTESGKPSTNAGALEKLGAPEVEGIIEASRLVKARDTFLAGIEREAVQRAAGWFLCPFFHLSRVISYRSSSADPNFQNYPKRVAEIMRIIRRAMRARPGYRLMGTDFSGVEIRGAYCYHKDPTMYADITDPKRDMHRDMAQECFKLSKRELGEKGKDKSYKELRHHGGKNGFVFPQFYGDYYAKCAKNMWDSIDLYHLKNAQGVPLKRHLKMKGVGTYTKFENHIKKVEDNFWNKRYPVYNAWKEEWVKQYNKRGYVDLLSGFRCRGYMRKNQVINFPIQGFSFHFLLWCAIRIDYIARKEKWKSLIVGQIHDEIILDVYEPELEHVARTVTRVMTEELPEAWPAIIIPLEVEAEVSEIGGNWSEMTAYNAA